EPQRAAPQLPDGRLSLRFERAPVLERAPGLFSGLDPRLAEEVDQLAQRLGERRVIRIESRGERLETRYRFAPDTAVLRAAARRGRPRAERTLDVLRERREQPARLRIDRRRLAQPLVHARQQLAQALFGRSHHQLTAGVRMLISIFTPFGSVRNSCRSGAPVTAFLRGSSPCRRSRSSTPS